MREKRMRMNKKMIGMMVALVGTVMAGLTSDAMAVPYASGIELNGASSSFVLNEDATNVTVVYDGGATSADLGTLAKGTHTFNETLGTSWEIVATKNAPVGWTQISDDDLRQSQYYSPMGVAVNQNPGSSHFGNIYVSEGRGWTTTSGRDTADGIYLMGADQSDIKSQGDTPAYPATGGVSWLVGDGIDPDTNNRNSPSKITIAPDDSLYIADWSDDHSGVWRAPADLAYTEVDVWPNILADQTNVNTGAGGLYDNHGSILSVWVEGTGGSTKLYTLDEDWPGPAVAPAVTPSGRGDILRYDIGADTNYTGQPVVQVDDATPAPDGKIWNALMDAVRDEDGTWWISQYRSDDSKEIPALSHWAADGATEPLWTSGKEPRVDGDFDWDNDVDGDDFLTWQQNSGAVGTGTVWTGDADGDTNVDGADRELWQDNFGQQTPAGVVLQSSYGNIDIHDDLDLLIMGARSGFGVRILDISDPSEPVVLDTISQSGYTRDVAFDIAGNAYIASSSSETLRIWSPGGDWIAATDSDGNFTLAQAPATAAVPEPGSLLLVALGLTCLAGGRFTSSQR